MAHKLFIGGLSSLTTEACASCLQVPERLNRLRW
jgi:hypothetical protein